MSCVGRGRAAGPTPSHEIIGQLNCANVGPLNCQLGTGVPMPTMDCHPGRPTCGNGSNGENNRQTSGTALNRSGRGGSANFGSTGGGGGSFNDPCGNGAADEPVDPQYLEGCRRIVDCMNRLWQEQKMCDVIIQAQCDQLKAHKLALAAYSDLLLDKFCKFPAGCCC